MINKKKLPKKSIFITPLGILIAFVILYSVMPLIPQLVSDYLSTYIYMAMLMILLVGILFSDSFHTMTRYIVMALPLVLLRFLDLMASRWAEVVLWGYGTLLFILPLLIGFYLCHVKKKLAPFENGVLLFAFATTMLTTVVGLIRYPSASRLLATEAITESPMLRVFNLNNIGGYDFIYLLVLLYPLLIYAYKHKKIKLFPAILISVAIFFCILQSEYTLALIFFAVSTVLFFVKKKFSQKNLLILILVSIILVILFRAQVAKLITWIAGFVESKDVRERLLAMAGGKEAMDAIDDKRIDLYLRSINTFLEQPLLGRLTPGASSLLAGNHSFLLDVLAEFGIVGGGLLFIIYRNVYNLFYKPFRKDSDSGFILWCFLQPLLLSLLNTGMWEFFLMLAAPVLIHVIRGEGEEAPAKQEDIPEVPADAPSETAAETPQEAAQPETTL